MRVLFSLFAGSVALAAAPAAAQGPADFSGFYAGILAGVTTGVDTGDYLGNAGNAGNCTNGTTFEETIGAGGTVYTVHLPDGSTVVTSTFSCTAGPGAPIGGGGGAGGAGGTGGTPSAPTYYKFTSNPTGFGVSAYGGYNMPFDSVVLGLEGDVGLVFGASSTFTYPADATRHDHVTLNGVGHLRGRVGYPVGRFMPFVAAGLAAASVTQSHTLDAIPATWSSTDLLVGPTVGAGVDMALGAGMTARLEVLEDVLPARHYEWTASPERYTNAQLSTTTVRAGVSFSY